ncbi:Cytochrome P450 [Penicillium cosmopolitanum]|uniref:Cytochrome P450 n=1 Tax=Penicillium cosmopolitanum TaxID=1131564 RepID=A0A9X0BC53_9EURO|nr:Cytochrome P450 [Penicillium cosmopolitanum]KAJ5404279.1 Cytochrome P450 [Penicillium cosmopolitanum]
MFIVIGLFIIFALCAYKPFFHPLFFSSLSSIPNANWLSAITPIWMQWKRFQGEEVSTFQNAFMTKGPIVRVSPNEIAVNDIDAVRVVHGYAQNNCTKTSSYSVFMHNGYAFGCVLIVRPLTFPIFYTHTTSALATAFPLLALIIPCVGIESARFTPSPMFNHPLMSALCFLTCYRNVFCPRLENMREKAPHWTFFR